MAWSLIFICIHMHSTEFIQNLSCVYFSWVIFNLFALFDLRLKLLFCFFFSLLNDLLPFFFSEHFFKSYLITVEIGLIFLMLHFPFFELLLQFMCNISCSFFQDCSLLFAIGTGLSSLVY